MAALIRLLFFGNDRAEARRKAAALERRPPTSLVSFGLLLFHELERGMPRRRRWRSPPDARRLRRITRDGRQRQCHLPRSAIGARRDGSRYLLTVCSTIRRLR